MHSGPVLRGSSIAVALAPRANGAIIDWLRLNYMLCKLISFLILKKKLISFLDLNACVKIGPWGHVISLCEGLKYWKRVALAYYKVHRTIGPKRMVKFHKIGLLLLFLRQIS